MVAKKIITSLFCTTLILGLTFIAVTEKQNKEIQEKSKINTAQNIKQNTKILPDIKKYDLYTETPYDLPLLSIYEISKIDETTKKIVDEFLEKSQGFYILKKVDDRILILLQNPIVTTNAYPRHDLQYVEILPNGEKLFHNAGYTGSEEEVYIDTKTTKDNWTFDKTTEPYRPLKHIAKDEKGKTKYTEYWNYSEKEPIKYQMKDKQGLTISLLKETQENETSYRKEHIFYDNSGNISMSITINYDGANISRFTYYNSHNSIDSISILSEFSDGYKTKELVYNENYKLVKTIIPIYKDGIRKELKIFDAEENLIEKISS